MILLRWSGLTRPQEGAVSMVPNSPADAMCDGIYENLVWQMINVFVPPNCWWKVNPRRSFYFVIQLQGRARVTGVNLLGRKNYSLHVHPSVFAH